MQRCGSLVGGQLQIAWRVQFQAASTDHRAFDHQEGTSFSLALGVKTAIISLPIARVALWSSWALS
jgi:hypothetical protein